MLGMSAKTSKKYLWWECVAIFGAIPLTLAFLEPRSWIYSLLWILALFAARWMAQNHYRLLDDWNWKAVNKAWFIEVLIRFVPLSIALALFTYFMIPEALFSLPLENPKLWILVMFFYPILSVLPQEFFFRSFFFKRYASLFVRPSSLVLWNAVAFGWMHVFLQNWVAVVFSFFGGLIFGGAYMKTRSLAAASIEHALYGCMVFTLGLGYYFYHGYAVR
jgi:membrane protease YdiL (CAAX protease family)